MKSNKWCLVPVHGDDNEHYLNVGETKIGRNLDADINIKSVFCSRNHCVINFSGNDHEIELVDSVSCL